MSESPLPQDKDQALQQHEEEETSPWRPSAEDLKEAEDEIKRVYKPACLWVIAKELRDQPNMEQMAGQLQDIAQSLHDQEILGSPSSSSAEEDMTMENLAKGWEPTPEDLAQAQKELNAVDISKTIIMASPVHSWVLAESIRHHKGFENAPPGTLFQAEQLADNMQANARNMHAEQVRTGQGPVFIRTSKPSPPPTTELANAA